MKNPLKLFALAAAFGSFTLSTPATPTLTLNDGVDPAVVIVDNAAGDLNPLSGAVTWSGSLGNWFLNVTTGVTKPVIGSAKRPEMELNSINASSTGGGNLTISFSENGFIPSGGLSTQVGGTLNGHSTLSASTWVNLSQVVAQSFLDSGSADVPFAGSAGHAFSATAGYTITEVVDIHHTSAGVTSLDYHLTVPDGGLTAGLLGFALIVAEGLRRRLAPMVWTELPPEKQGSPERAGAGAARPRA